MRHALDVANYYVLYSAYTKTRLQVMMLTYVAHGHMLAIHDEPLIGDMVEAWDFGGPMIPAIYNEFKRWHLGPIGRILYEPESFTEQEKEIVDETFASYGKYCGYYLSQITNQDDDTGPTPYEQCRIKGKKTIIPDEITKEYYRKITGIQDAIHC